MEHFVRCLQKYVFVLKRANLRAIFLPNRIGLKCRIIGRLRDSDDDLSPIRCHRRRIDAFVHFSAVRSIVAFFSCRSGCRAAYAVDIRRFSLYLSKFIAKWRIFYCGSNMFRNTTPAIRRSTTCRSTSRAVRSTDCWGPTVRERRRSSASSTALRRPTKGGCSSTDGLSRPPTCSASVTCPRSAASTRR